MPIKNRRLALVAGLGVVELWVFGLIIRSIGGTREAEFAPPAGPASYPMTAQAADGNPTRKTFTIGSSPHVIIDADGAALKVSVRSGTVVTVAEERQRSGWFRNSNRPVTIERTSDGIRISSNDDGSAGLGPVRRRIEVSVPPQTQLDVQNAGSTAVSGLRADVRLHSDEGSISVNDQRGAVSVKTDNGRIELRAVDAPSINIGSDNGRVVFEHVRAGRVDIATDNGRVDVSNSVLRAGQVRTDSGTIRLGLGVSSNVTINARGSSGKVVALAPLTLTSGDDDDDPSTIRVGSGAGRLDVQSDDGSITVLVGEEEGS